MCGGQLSGPRVVYLPLSARGQTLCRPCACNRESFGMRAKKAERTAPRTLWRSLWKLQSKLSLNTPFS
jgi:hypothetical protein